MNIIDQPSAWQIWRSKKHPTRVVRIILIAKRGTKQFVVHTLQKGIEQPHADEMSFFMQRFEKVVK